MARERRILTITWNEEGGSSTNRLNVRLRWVQIAAAGVVVAALTAVVASAVALWLQRENGQLFSRCKVLEQDRVRLEERIRTAKEEMQLARDSLTRVRIEEAKIRSWLGLGAVEEEALPAEPADPEGAPPEGGKGSPGEEGLESVAPRARGIEAEVVQREGLGGIVAESRALAADLADLAVYVEQRKKSWDAIPAISPVDGEHWVSSGFGWRSSPFTGKREFHSGIDMAGRKGTPVVAAANGTVVHVFNDSALGRGLSIDHGNRIRTIYGHLEQVLVERGAVVQRGRQVGRMGSSGRRSTGPHLHYAVKVDDQYVNPADYLLDRSQQWAAIARN